MGGDNHFQYAPNPNEWIDILGLKGVTVKSAPSSSPFDFYLVLDSSVYPETAAHIKDAILNKNKDSIVTWDPADAKVRRNESLKGIPCQSGKDRDEWPMAVFMEGGLGASVKHINPSDNRGAGKSIQLALTEAGVDVGDAIKFFIK